MKKSVNLPEIAYGILILLLISLIPFLLICPYVYPFSDDFTFATYTRMAVTESSSLPQMLWTLLHHAVINTYDCYVEWQGTFTTSFLMAFSPAIFGYRYYHLVPVIVISIFCLAFYDFLHTVICRIASAPRYDAIFIFSLTTLMILQNSPDMAQAFCWFSSAVPYTIGNAIWLFFFGRQLRLGICAHEERRISAFRHQLPLCLLAFLTGGINHITIVWAFMILVTMWIVLFLLKLPVHVRKTLLPSSLFLLAGLAANLLCPGSRLRMAASGGNANGILITIIKSFHAGAVMALRWMNPTVIIYIVLLLPFIRVSLNSFLKRSRFSFPLPGLCILYSYCLFSGLFAPMLYVADRYDTLRPHTASHPLFILLVLFNVAYVMGYLQVRHKRLTIHERLDSVIRKPLRYYAVTLSAMFFVCLIMTLQKPVAFSSVSCIVSLINGNARELGEIMEYNFTLLEDPSTRDVKVLHVPLKSSALTSEEIADWKDGAVLFYQKDSVTYLDDSNQS